MLPETMLATAAPLEVAEGAPVVVTFVPLVPNFSNVRCLSFHAQLFLYKLTVGGGNGGDEGSESKSLELHFD